MSVVPREIYELILLHCDSDTATSMYFASKELYTKVNKELYPLTIYIGKMGIYAHMSIKINSLEITVNRGILRHSNNPLVFVLPTINIDGLNHKIVVNASNITNKFIDIVLLK